MRRISRSSLRRRLRSGGWGRRSMRPFLLEVRRGETLSPSHGHLRGACAARVGERTVWSGASAAGPRSWTSP